MVMVQTSKSVGGVLTVRVQQWHSIQGKQISTLQWLHPTVSLATLLVSDAHQASYKGHNLGKWSAGHPGASIVTHQARTNVHNVFRNQED